MHNEKYRKSHWMDGQLKGLLASSAAKFTIEESKTRPFLDKVEQLLSLYKGHCLRSSKHARQNSLELSLFLSKKQIFPPSV
jgi:hypothetical protein